MSGFRRDFPLATYHASDANVVVSAHADDDLDAWNEYLIGLHRTYTKWGVAHILTDDLADSPSPLFWLLRPAGGGQAIGGMRCQGPHDTVGDYDGIHEMEDSNDVGHFESLLEGLLEKGVIEFKGIWSQLGGLGSVVGRCQQHSLWWFGAEHGFCIASDHVSARWSASGASPQIQIEPVPFPSSEYSSIPYIWDDGYHFKVSAKDRALLHVERRCLRPARDLAMYGTSNSEWQPEILLEGEPRIETLRSDGTTMVDHVPALAEELQTLLPPVGSELLQEPNRWVYYPWRNTAVRILGPSAYRRIRTDRNRNKLTSDQLDDMAQRSIGVVGLSVGHSASYVAAQEGLCGHLSLTDFDSLELSNMNRIPVSILDLGMSKARITARRIAELDPYIDIGIFEDGFSSENATSFMAGLDVVVEECDSIDVKILVRQLAAKARIPVLMETSDRGLLDVERFDLEPDRPPFHGLVREVDLSELSELSTDDKVPYVLSILEAGELSAKMAASMVEIDSTTRSWPQLASDVAFGSCLIAASLRELFITGDLPSGRARFDLNDLKSELKHPAVAEPTEPPVLTRRSQLSDDFATALVEAAQQAPSGGNVQPWTFKQSQTSFEVHLAEHDRVGMDINGRGSAVACGAALANAAGGAAARSRMAATGPVVDFSVDASQPTLMGRLRLGDAIDPSWADLAPHVVDRVTNRQEAESTEVDRVDMAALRSEAETVGGQLHYIRPTDLEQIIPMWAESDRARYLNERLHREMMGELRRPGLDALDIGIDERTLELSPSDRAKLAIIRRQDIVAELATWGGGRRLGEDTERRLARSGGLLVFTVEGFSLPDYVRGGVALQRAWLRATALGLSFQPMSPVFGYAQSEEELVEIFGAYKGRDLFLLRNDAFEAIGLKPDEAFVLAVRIHQGPPPTAISERRAEDQIADNNIEHRYRSSELEATASRSSIG